MVGYRKKHGIGLIVINFNRFFKIHFNFYILQLKKFILPFLSLLILNYVLCLINKLKL